MQYYYGEEQDFYLYDTSASNYLYGYVFLVWSTIIMGIHFRMQASGDVQQQGMAEAWMLLSRLRSVLQHAPGEDGSRLPR